MYEPEAAIEPEVAEPEKPEEADCGANTEPEVNTKPRVALTFDDGPSPYTDRILDLLERYGGRATFFVLGRNVEFWQNTIIRTVSIGSEVANHTWTHPELPSLNNQRIKEELQTTSEIIERFAGYSPRFFRPPFGMVTQRVATVSKELGYAIVNWTLDTKDWQVRNADAVYNAIMDAIEENAIVLMHDIHSTTAAAMERVIPALIADGFQLVTVSELLHYLHGEPEPGKVYGFPGIR